MPDSSPFIPGKASPPTRDNCKQRPDEPFAFWGPTPEQARLHAVAKNKRMHDKQTTAKEAVKRFLRDGINIGIGGFVNTRPPVSLIHEVIRQGARDLTLSFTSSSICCELLAGAMILDPKHLSIRRIELAWYGYESIGLAPLLRYLASTGRIQFDDYTNYGMSARFKAAAMGVPYLPTRDHGGTDLELVNRGKMTECPFTGDNLYLVAACHPDLAIIHTQAADSYGNCRTFGTTCSCPEIAQAAVNTIISTEQILSNVRIRNYPNLTTIPFPAVDAVVHQPFGATPGACYGYYWYDMDFLREFRDVCEDFRLTGSKKKLRYCYDKHIFCVEHFDEFLEQKPVPILKRLCRWDRDQPIILD